MKDTVQTQYILMEQKSGINGDIVFSVNAPEGHWLVFDENLKGATYNAPQFVKQGEVTSEPPLEMVRNGYTFGGWYTNKECTDGNEFTFGEELEDNITIYAKWTAATTANYTIIIWKQSLNGETYDFEESVNLSGNVGTAIDTVRRRIVISNAYAIVNDVNKQYDGFYLKQFDQDVTVKAEGNSVLNVYYDRKEYTLTFQVRDYIHTPTTSNNGTQYGLVDGQYVQLTRHGRGNQGNPYYWTYNDTWISEGPTYTGTRYTRSNSQSWQTIKEIKRLYQQNIADQFPIVGTNGVTYNNGERWMPQSSSTLTM